MSKTDWIGPTERAHYRGLADDTQAEIERAHAVALLWNEVWQLDDSGKGFSYRRSYLADKAMGLERSLPDLL